MPSPAEEVVLNSGGVTLAGTLVVPAGARGLVLFAHGSGSSRYSPRNRTVAGFLNAGGLGTLLFDLLTERESEIDEHTGELRFDIGLLSRRLAGAVDWAGAQPRTQGLRVGLFGASTGAAAALNAAAERPGRVAAVVSRGGRPDLAMEALPRVQAPTLLLVGGLDGVVIGMNERAAARLACEHRLEIVPGATHLFEEPGKLEAVARLATDWFQRHLGTPDRDAPGSAAPELKVRSRENRRKAAEAWRR
jgi:dienelactone hydrolase